MATLITGQSQLLTLQPSDKYTVTVGANTEAYIDLGAGTDGSGYDSVRLTSEGTNRYTIGEYGRVAKVTIRCVVGVVDYMYGDSGVSSRAGLTKLYPDQFGVVSDGKVVTDASWSGGVVGTLTSGSAGFRLSDVGKRAMIRDRAVAGPFTVRSGFISQYISPSQVEVTLTSSLSAVPDAQFAFGTNDGVAWQAYVSACEDAGCAILVPEGITIINPFALTKSHMRIIGVGSSSVGAVQSLRHTGTSCLMAHSYAAGNFIRMEANSTIKDVDIDAFNRHDVALNTRGASDAAGGVNVVDCNLTGGIYTTGAFGRVNNIKNSVITGTETLDHLVTMYGDSRLTGCDVYGAGPNKFQVRTDSHDVRIDGNHFWKIGEVMSAGGCVLYDPYSTTEVGGSVSISNNVFDTSNGAHVEVNVKYAMKVRGVTINNNTAFQHPASADNTYNYIIIKGVAGSTIKGLAINGNVGESAFGVEQSKGTYKAFVDGSGMLGTIVASTQIGNAIANCNAGNVSFTPSVGANLNVRTAGVNDTATVF